MRPVDVSGAELSSALSRGGAEGPAAVWNIGPDGRHFYLDSEAITQAVYVYQPIFDAGGLIVDLEVIRVNDAAKDRKSTRLNSSHT